VSPKPLRNGMSGWLGRRKTRLRSLVVVGTATLGMAGLGLAAAGPASADPAVNYVAVGSDTIQDVMNAFAGGVSDGIIGSYDAVNPVSATAGEIITPARALAGGSQSNCSFTRPNGSTQGFQALDASNGGTLVPPGTPPQAGCIAISRSSSGPGSISQTAGAPGAPNPAGQLIYVPFAVDAVTTATGPTTAAQTTTTKCVAATAGCTNGLITFTVPVTQITNADLFTITDLKNLFDCSTTTLPVEGGVTYWPLGSTITKPAGAQQVDLYVPQAGSGTLKFWAAQMGFDPVALNSCLHQTILSGPAVSVAVEEHDGSAYASDPMGLGPFSIAQWVAQSNGHNDRRHTAIIHSINGVAPTSGGVLNGAFPILREVYNVVLFSSIDPTSATFDPLLAGLLSGSGSRLCNSTLTIRSFGFATLPNAALPDACGATTSTLRVNL